MYNVVLKSLGKLLLKITTFLRFRCPLFYYGSLNFFLRDVVNIVDLGCGENSPLKILNKKHWRFTVGVDLNKHALLKAKENKTHDEFVLCDCRALPFSDKSFDAAMALDLIEHLRKEEGWELIKSMEALAKSKIILSTPNGFLKLKWWNGNPLSLHRSGWTVDEFRKLNFKVFRQRGFKFLQGGGSRLSLRFLISSITQSLFAFYCPRISFQLLAVKDLCKSLED